MGAIKLYNKTGTVFPVPEPCSVNDEFIISLYLCHRQLQSTNDILEKYEITKRYLFGSSGVETNTLWWKFVPNAKTSSPSASCYLLDCCIYSLDSPLPTCSIFTHIPSTNTFSHLLHSCHASKAGEIHSFYFSLFFSS